MGILSTAKRSVETTSNRHISDYMLRLTATVPMTEENQHDAKNEHCKCKPTVDHNDATRWTTITHNKIANEAIECVLHCVECGKEVNVTAVKCGDCVEKVKQ